MFLSKTTTLEKGIETCKKKPKAECKPPCHWFDPKNDSRRSGRHPNASKPSCKYSGTK